MRRMGIEDRDYMKSSSTAAPTILGLPRWLFATLLIAIMAGALYMSGAFDKFIKPGKPAKEKKEKVALAGPVNINTASLDELKALPDVDTKVAEDIIKKRPFKTLEDILEVKGIGEKKLEKLRPNLTL